MMPSAYPMEAVLRHATSQSWLWLVVVTWVVGGLGAPDASAAEVSHVRRLMGVEWIVTVHAASTEEAAAAADAALDRVAAIEQVLSDYDPTSEVSQLMATTIRKPGLRVPVSDDLARTLRASLALTELTDGAFDVTVGSLTTLWRQARKTGRMPNAEKLAAARAGTGPGSVVLHAGDHDEASPQRPRVSLNHPSTKLDFGGIGMGYAIDAAMHLLEERGIHAAMIDASGDIAVSGPPPGREHWRIAVPPLMRQPASTVSAAANEQQAVPTLALVHAAVATSGDAYQAVVIDGIRYSHIVDPRTGLGVVGPTAVTVIAPDATSADALSTALSVLGPREGLPLAEELKGVAARCSWVDGDALRVESSARWANFLEPR
jgi:thiamine biosynthesis lipoprotein